MDFLAGLNEQQRHAVTAGDGPVLIVAGPGTGKTKTLTARIAYLLTGKHAAPAEIVALTFTAKAAREMRERLAAVFGTSENLPKIMTFHALAREMLKQNGATQTLINEQKRLEIIRAFAKPAAFKGLGVRDLSLLISRAKTTLLAPAAEPTKQLLAQYQAALSGQNLHDFDDLLSEAYNLLQNTGAQNYRYVLVDEFQDTSELQYEILKLLSAARNIFAIGDPNQSIYAFRGAGAEMFGRFRDDFPATQTINLSINYRSRPEIVRLANAIFPDSPQLVSHQTGAGAIQNVQTLNEYSEADFVIGEIENGIGGSDFLRAHADAPARQPRDYAVLYRTHRTAKTLQKAFAEAGIPYQIAGEGSPYERPAIQTVVGGLRFLHDPVEANLPAVKSLKPTQVRALLEKIQPANDVEVCAVATAIAQAFGVAEDPGLPQFLGTLVQFGTCKAGLAATLKHIAQIAESEFYDPLVNAVTLLTIHAGKGLEFGHVFLCAAEETILPKLNKKGEGNLDEERRLFYVAATRAKECLDILHVKIRAGNPAQPSRFVTEISAEILPRTTDPNMAALEKRLKKRTAKRAQTSLF